jgi:hypothetical protein
MNSSDKYKKAFDAFYSASLDDEKILDTDKSNKKSNRHIFNRWAITVASFIVVLSTVTLVASAAGWRIGDIFRIGFNDDKSADLIEEGTVQELELVNENDDFTLKLITFTGDMETHIAMFELIPKAKWSEVSEIRLIGQTFCPCILEAEAFDKYGFHTAKGFELTYDEDKNAYYFSYKLPPYWVRDVQDEDIILRIAGIDVIDRNGFSDYFDCEMFFRFTPDRSMLKPSIKVTLNKQISKMVYEYSSIPLNDGNGFYNGEIIANTAEKSIIITDVVFSGYKTIVNGIIPDDKDPVYKAGLIWDQFTEPKFITEHYFNGLENKYYYECVLINNEERIRLFVDDMEIPLIEESLIYMPGKGHDDNGKSLTEGDYGCAIEFEGFDYESAGKVEIRFGDEIITIK